MKKQNKKLLIFWIISAFFLLGWSFYWLHPRNEKNDASVPKKIEETKVAYDIWSKISEGDQEKTFLLLFQNDMELRPSGGYIGTFGILKIKNGKEIAFGSHNTNAFDGRVPDGTPVPYPMEETLKIKSWKMRDANWYPDWKDSALQAEKFYRLGDGQEKFDGIIGINSNVLTSFLKITGPIEISGIEEPFSADNAVLKLEYLVEKDFVENNPLEIDRKKVISDLGKTILEKISNLSLREKLELLKVTERDLNNKNIQLFFKDSELQNKIEEQNWGGRMNVDWKENYLMLVDANLSALKTNRVVDYSFDYFLDLTQEKPELRLTIKITNNGQEEDWITRDYQGFLRVYLPNSAWLLNPQDFKGIKFEEKYGKKSIGFIAQVPLGESREFVYDLTFSKELKNQYQQLLIQKQSGMKDVKAKLTIKQEDGNVKTKELTIEKDEPVEF